MVNYMADSVIAANIPAKFRAYRNYGAGLYGTGQYAVSKIVADTFPRHVLIDVDASNPDLCDILDSERFDATPVHWPAWRAERDKWCRERHIERFPKIYCSIDPGDGYGVEAVLDACESANQLPPEHWWIAWYTPNHIPPTAQQVADEIKRLTNCIISPSKIWGCQYANFGSYDASIIYQDPEWA